MNMGLDLTRRRFVKNGLAAGMLPALLTLDARAQDGSVTLVHSAPVALPLWAITYLAEDMGYYKDEGLKITRVSLNNGPVAMAALLGKQGMCSFSTPGETIAAKLQGQDVKLIMSLGNYSAFTLIASKAFAEKHGITSDSPVAARKAALKAATGVRLGITVPGSLTDALTRIFIKDVGNDPATQASIVPMQSVANILAGISNNGVDGFLGPSPATEQAMAELKAIALLRVDEVPQAAKLAGQTQIIRGEDVGANRSVLAALVRAQLKAMRSLSQDPTAAGQLLAKTRFSTLPPDLWQAVWKGQVPSFKSPVITRGSIEAWIDAGLVGSSASTASYPFDQLIDMQFVQQGLKDINWSVPA